MPSPPDAHSLILRDPAAPSKRERLTGTFGCGALFYLLGGLFAARVALDGFVHPALLLIPVPGAVVAAAWMHFINRTKQIKLHRVQNRISLPSKAVVDAGGHVVLVEAGVPPDDDASPPVSVTYLINGEIHILSRSVSDIVAARRTGKRLADFFSAHFRPEVLLPEHVPVFARLPKSVLPPRRKGLCPRCDSALDRLGGPLDEYRCETCQGRLVTTTGVERLVEQELGIERDVVYDLRNSGARNGGVCPQCITTMHRTRLKGEEVDLCGGCGALWLDAGELSRISQGRYAEHPEDIAPDER